MVDRGLFNYIKNAIARGESKEAIESTLLKSGSNQDEIEAAYKAVQNNESPSILSPNKDSVLDSSNAPTPRSNNFNKKYKFAAYLIVLVVILLVVWFFLGRQLTGGYTVSSLNANKYTSTNGSQIQNTVNTTNVLPDNATIANIGNGLMKYSNPKFHISFEFPANTPVDLSIRSATPYSVILNKGDSSIDTLNFDLYDQNDPVSSMRGKPESTPPLGTNDSQSILVDGSQFIESDNIAAAKQYHYPDFEVRATDVSELNFLPGDMYSIVVYYEFTDVSNLDKYTDSVKQVINSLTFN